MVKIMNRNKSGYSLFEACVVMVIAAIFIAVIANVIPHKAKSKVSSEIHGRFECYYDGGTLYQQMFTENSTSGRKTASSAGGTSSTCKFTPPDYAKYLIINAVGGGAGGSSIGSGSAGEFSSSFWASLYNSYTISPGYAGMANQNGDDTAVYGGTDMVEVISASGGKTARSDTLENTTIDDVLSCTITDYAQADEYDCKTSPNCEIVNGMIQVSFCRTKDLYKTVNLTYKKTDSEGEVILNNPRYIVNNKYTERKAGKYNVWIYHDISVFSDFSDVTNPVVSGWSPSTSDDYYPSLYTMELVMDISSDVDYGNDSNLGSFVESMQYSTEIKNADVGQGGAMGGAGKPGAVVIMW